MADNWLVVKRDDRISWMLTLAMHAVCLVVAVVVVAAVRGSQPMLVFFYAIALSIAHPLLKKTRRPAEEDADEEAAAGTPAPATKKCPRCAEEIQIAARVCRYCSHEFDEASLQRAVAEAEATRLQSAASRSAARSEAKSAAARRVRYRHFERQRFVTILLVYVGLLLPAGLLSTFVNRPGQPPADPPPFVPIAMLAIYAAFGIFAVWHGRRARRRLIEFEKAAEAEGVRYRCACGKPMREYFWLHYVICSVIPAYGFLAVLAKKKKCRGCGRPFEPLRKEVVSSGA